MFGKMKSMAAQMQMMQKLMKDENFKALIAHPKMQELLRDPEFLELMKTKDFQKASSNPKIAALKNDPELLQLIAKVQMPQI
jgi:hypothetical protein